MLSFTVWHVAVSHSLKPGPFKIKPYTVAALEIGTELIVRTLVRYSCEHYSVTRTTTDQRKTLFNSTGDIFKIFLSCK